MQYQKCNVPLGKISQTMLYIYEKFGRNRQHSEIGDCDLPKEYFILNFLNPCIL